MRYYAICLYAVIIGSLVSAAPAAALSESQTMTPVPEPEVSAPLEDVPPPAIQSAEPAASIPPTPSLNENITPEVPTEPPVSLMVLTAPEPPVTVAKKLIVSEVRLRTCTASCQTESKDGSFVELYNPEAVPVVVTNWKVNYYTSSTTFAAPTTVLATIQNVVIAAHGYAVVGIAVSALHDAPVITMAAAGIGNKTSGYIRVVDSDGGVVDQVGWGSVTATGTRLFAAPAINSSAQMCETNEVITTTGVFAEYATVTPGGGVACVIVPPPVTAAVNLCNGVVISEIGANRDDQFIEIYNLTDNVVDITGCQVQTNRSTTKSYVFGSETIGPGAYRVVMIKDTSLTLTKTTTGVVYLLSSDGKIETDSQAYSTLSSGTSWARFGDEWRQTYSSSPGGANINQAYLPCDDGYVRNEATGRCNKIAVAIALGDCGEGKYRSEETGRCRSIPAESVLTACKLGQYRSEETNRCRNLVTASALKPCKDGQYRSEETNRCRNIATASANLKPCKENQYRSEETNRCRNLPAKTVPAAAYAVESVKDGAKVFAGWWALGGVMMAAVAYAIWEWRSEIRRLVSGFPISVRKR